MEKIRINKYISDAGFCSRREADQLIADERVTVNGVLAVMGTKVSMDDKVRIDGEILHLVERPEDKKTEKKSSQRQKKSSFPSSKEGEPEAPKKTVQRGTRGGGRKNIEKRTFPQPKSADTFRSKTKKSGRSGNR